MKNELEEALSEELLVGPLTLVADKKVERRRAEPAPEPTARDLPIVSIGRPKAWLLKTAGPAGREALFVVRFACSFRPRKRDVGLSWARFAVRFLPDGHGRQPYAQDLYPNRVERESKVSKKIALGPSLKFKEVEGKLGSYEYSVEYPAVEPVVSAAGFGETICSWDFNSLPQSPLGGGKLLVAAITAPAALSQMEVGLALSADLEYQGFRLPTWLTGAEKEKDIAVKTVVWRR